VATALGTQRRRTPSGYGLDAAAAAMAFFDGQPSGRESERADGVWGVVGKGAQRKQPQVEIDLLLPPADMHSPLGVDQLHAVADGDIRDMRFGIRRVILAQQEARRRPATGWAIGKRREGRR